MEGNASKNSSTESIVSSLWQEGARRDCLPDITLQLRDCVPCSEAALRDYLLYEQLMGQCNLMMLGSPARPAQSPGFRRSNCSGTIGDHGQFPARQYCPIILIQNI
jgi:hypothetical protein